VRSILAIQAFSALRESRKRYVFRGENVIGQGLGGKISSVAASHSLTLQNGFFWSVSPAVSPVSGFEQAGLTASIGRWLGRV
jgi:hypothetical protein